VITVFRAGEENGVLYIAMEYVEGTDLRAVIDEQGALDPAAAAEIVAQVADALDAAHAKGLVHRDVKPANVLMEYEGGRPHAYLTDFGLTKDVASQSGMTATGVFVGTVDYIAPEQIRGDVVDARTDVYSLGCVLYEALTASVPYPRESTIAKIYAHSQEPAPLPSASRAGVSPALDDVVARAMAKDPDERQPSAGDLGRATIAAASGGALPAAPERSVAVGAAAPTRLARRSEPTRRRRWGLIAGVALGGLAVAGAVIAVAAGGGGETKNAPPAMSKESYQDALLDAVRGLKITDAQVAPKLPQHVKATDQALVAGSELAKLRTEVSKDLTKLRSLTPPDDVRDLHARFVAVFDTLEGRLADAVAAADARNDARYRATLATLSGDLGLDPLAREYGKRGYTRLGEQAGQ
jgi:serine/threonine-protein kinase